MAWTRNELKKQEVCWISKGYIDQFNLVVQARCVVNEASCLQEIKDALREEIENKKSLFEKRNKLYVQLSIQY